MKNISKILFAFLLAAMLGCTSCADMLDTDSDRYLMTENNKLNSANDSLYSVVGILRQMQKLSENYVLLGELRGDLMDVTVNADVSLRNVADFNVLPNDTNRYVNAKEYYAVINNCNYFLTHVDTTIVSNDRLAMLYEYAVVKTFRAWTYWQLALNYGEVKYMTQPILTLAEMDRQDADASNVYDLKRLADVLIQDLIPYVTTFTPGYGKIGSKDSKQLFLPTVMLVADLCLWSGQYETAATIYYQYFKDPANGFSHRSGGNNMNLWMDNTFTALMRLNGGYAGVFLDMDPSEVLALTTFSNNNGSELKLIDAALRNYTINPSRAARDLFDNEDYTWSGIINNRDTVLYTKGDLRGQSLRMFMTGSYDWGYLRGDSIYYISKYGALSVGMNVEDGIKIESSVALYRTQISWLHYAEALNWAGYPSLAFAILKYGLYNETLRDPKKVSSNEVGYWTTVQTANNQDSLVYRFSPPAFADFTNPKYNPNDGNYPMQPIHMRGSGQVSQDTLYYTLSQRTSDINRALNYYGFPEELKTKQDSTLFVDAMIFKELGLESAFEGNRFPDLVRFATRRDEPAFLAKWVARRNPALETKLMDPKNWFFPKKK